MRERACYVLAALIAFASSSDAGETRRGQPDVARPAASITELDWLAGAWIGDGIAGSAREVYSPPIADAIVGHFVQQRGEDIWFYELVLIRKDGDSLTYCLKHFNSDLTGWEEKNAVQCFPLVARDEHAFYFDGLTIRRDGTNRMVSTVRVETDAGQKELVFRYRRE